MVRSDKNPLAETGTGEGEEIDRIMKEIEDLEKRMDSSPDDATPSSEPVAAPEEDAERASSGALPQAAAAEPDDDVSPFAPSENETQSKVVPMRPALSDSLAETDAVPARDEPLVREGGESAADGGLSMKIGGCTEVSLEFTRAGLSVSLSCTDEALTITTDQGAEFRIPFKRTA